MMSSTALQTKSYAVDLSPEDYFHQVYAAFCHASENMGDVRRYYKIGEDVLCLRLAGPALLAPLTLAVSHLETAPVSNPSLTICCWDTESTGVSIPDAPWPATAYGARGHIVGYNTPPIHTLYQPGINIFNMLNTRRNLGFYWIQSATHIPYWECSFPMRGLLHWWSKTRPVQLVHAGAVGTEKGGILLTGKSGSGKSTTALSCLNSSLGYVGDDYVLMSLESKPYVYSLYNTAKLTPESVKLLPWLKSKISNPDSLDTEKAVIHLQDQFPEKLRLGFPLKAIFLPRVMHTQQTKLRSASPVQALFALAPTTVFQLEGNGTQAFEKMQRLVREIPSYWLELGTDIDRIPEVISQFLES